MIQEFHIGKHRLLFDLQPDQFVSDRNLLWYARARGVGEPEVIHVMLRALREGDCAVDAGANIGFFTVLMSKIVGPTGQVIAIEPDSRNLEKLKKNLDINSCDNVAVMPCALGSGTAVANIYRADDNGQTTLFGEGMPHDVVGLETLCTLLGEACPTLLKMDIEGSEVSALLGCTYDFPYIVAEVNEKALKRAGRSAHDLFTLMEQRGYLRYQLHTDGSMPSRVYAHQTVRFTRENANMLFAHPLFVAGKLWPEVEI